MSLFSTSDGEKIKVGNLDVDVSDLFMVNISYATYTEYGYPPAPTNTIDSTAIVIDPETLALPAPAEQVRKKSQVNERSRTLPKS
jgi:hypothetical protein